MPDKFILQIAQKHIQDLNDNNEYSDQFHYSISKPLEVADGYLFEYELNLSNEDSTEAFGGAPAFFVSDNGTEFQDVSWGEYNEMKNSL